MTGAYDPFGRFNRNLESPAGHAFLITPDDDHDLEAATKRFRVYNDLDTVGQITFVMVSGATIVFAVPPLSIVWEDLRIKRVMATGTTSNLVIHGFSDE